MKHVLDGYRVLDFTQVLAGPTVTRLMAEMGAEIIKVELMPGGDLSRNLPYLKDGRSAYYIQQNRGKKSLCLNPRDPRGQEILKGLVKEVDVVLENFSRGVLARFGLDWDTVHALNPRAVMCAITAFGQSGPLADLPGFDFIGAAYAGVLDMIGHADGPPLFPQLAMGDVNTGVHALAAITAALLDREDTGEGQFVDISLLDTYFHMHEVNVQAYSGSQGQIRPRRSGPHHYAISPLGIWKGKAPERWLLLIPLLPAQWEAMCKLMGRADILTDPRFATNADRVANEPELIEIIQNWIDAQESDEAIIRMFNEQRIPIAPILSVPEAMAHPHLIERETIRTVHDRAFGDLQIPGVPLRFSRFKNDLPLEAAFLGEHSREVLREFLGYSDEAIAALESDGVIKTSDQAA